ncbi:hypothetical protein DRJ19_02010, partial [Candidatus Woesearchaeota archaeon]
MRIKAWCLNIMLSIFVLIEISLIEYAFKVPLLVISGIFILISICYRDVFKSFIDTVLFAIVLFFGMLFFLSEALSFFLLLKFPAFVLVLILVICAMYIIRKRRLKNSIGLLKKDLATFEFTCFLVLVFVWMLCFTTMMNANFLTLSHAVHNAVKINYFSDYIKQFNKIPEWFAGMELGYPITKIDSAGLYVVGGVLEFLFHLDAVTGFNLLMFLLIGGIMITLFSLLKKISKSLTFAFLLVFIFVASPRFINLISQASMIKILLSFLFFLIGLKFLVEGFSGQMKMFYNSLFSFFFCLVSHYVVFALGAIFVFCYLIIFQFNSLKTKIFLLLKKKSFDFTSALICLYLLTLISYFQYTGDYLY